MRLRSPHQLVADDIVQWAHDDDPGPPENADPNVWELILLDWHADDRLYVELASKPARGPSPMARDNSSCE